MRSLVLFILLGLLSGAGLAQEKVVQTFNGTSALSISFQAQDKWELRWEGADPLKIILLSPDGAIIAGAAGSPKGSLYQPKGGSFHLQISPGPDGAASPWHVSVVEIGPALAANGTNAASAKVSPKTIPAPGSTTPASAPSTNSATASPAAATLTGAQARAVVLIKGDLTEGIMEGTGFLVKTADGPAVVTNLHVISANPNVKILTTTGEQIKVLSLKGASDRDLAMFMIQDDHYTYLDLAADIPNTVQPGDEVITPGNSEGGEVMLDTKGTVLGIGPQRIEFSNPIYHGNSGGPVFHTKSGKVLAVVTNAMKVITSDDVDKASFGSKDSAISGSMRYFGLRLDTVPKWEVYDWDRFLSETTFLKNFHEQSRCLDSYLNGARYERAKIATVDENGPPDAQYYLRNDKILAVRDNYHKLTVDMDNSQKLDAEREWVMDIESIADADMDTIQNPDNFYSYDQLRAEYEIKYRKYLRTQIEKVADRISDLGH